MGQVHGRVQDTADCLNLNKNVKKLTSSERSLAVITDYDKLRINRWTCI